MKIVNIPITVIEAEEGKLLRKISTGRIAGKKVTLGYNYYELGFGLSEPVYERPEDYEEIDEFEGWEETELIDQVQRLKRASELVAQNKAEINTLGLSGKQALDVPMEWFPVWGKDFKEGDMIVKGTRFNFNGVLYEVVQDHTILAHYEPSINTLALYRKVTEQEGTKEDPIPYKLGMVAYKDMYYTENDTIYICIQDYDGSTVHMPSVLHSFFKEVEEESAGAGEGTIENPIKWSGSGLLIQGTYYEQDGVKYLCTRDSGIELTFPLSSLIGTYVQDV